MARRKPPIDADAQVSKARAERQWYIDLVRSQEEFANRDPAGYRRRVRSLGMLASAYLYGVLLLGCLVMAGTIWLVVARHRAGYGEFKLLLFAGFLVWAIARALYVRFPEPDGHRLERSEAPELFAEVEAIADQLGAPRPDRIYLTLDLNASASQIPKFGLFGGHRNDLALGLPLLLALTPDEARSVIAHEFGHFGGEHGKFGAWAYRVNQTWDRLREKMEGDRASFLFRSFFNWFSPRFSATTVALRRAFEYEADAAAAKVGGVGAATDALMRFPYLNGHIDEHYWKPLGKRVLREPQPPKDSYRDLAAACGIPARPEQVERQLAWALAAETGYGDSHPSLRDRLKALGRLPAGDLGELASRLAEPPAVSAAAKFLGSNLDRVAARAEAAHFDGTEAAWAASHAELSADWNEFERLRAKPEIEAAEAERLAVLTYQNLDGEPMLEALRDLVSRFPDDLGARFLLARGLLDEDDPAGVEMGRSVVDKDPDYQDAFHQALAGFHARRGESDRLEEVLAAAADDHVRQGIDLEAASSIKLTDELLPPLRPERERVALREALGKVPQLESAYLTRMVLPATGLEGHVLHVFHRPKLMELGNEGEALVAEVAAVVETPSRTLIWAPSPKKKWAAKLEAIEGAKVFP